MWKYKLFFVAIAIAIVSMVGWLIYDFPTWDREYGETQMTQGVVVRHSYKAGYYKPKMGEYSPARWVPASYRTVIQCAEPSMSWSFGTRSAYDRTSLNSTVTVHYRECWKVRYETKWNAETQQNEKVEVERKFAGYDLVSWE